MPERTAVEVAKQILDVFAEAGDRQPALWQIDGLGRTLYQRTSSATGIIANVRICLLAAYNSRKHTGRADEIRSTARQLAEMVIEYPDLSAPVPPDDDLPF